MVFPVSGFSSDGKAQTKASRDEKKSRKKLHKLLCVFAQTDHPLKNEYDKSPVCIIGIFLATANIPKDPDVHPGLGAHGSGLAVGIDWQMKAVDGMTSRRRGEGEGKGEDEGEGNTSRLSACSSKRIASTTSYRVGVRVSIMG